LVIFFCGIPLFNFSENDGLSTHNDQQAGYSSSISPPESCFLLQGG